MIHLGVFLSRLRKLPALIFWLVKDVYRYFKNHEGKHFHQWGLHIYLGKFGAGKTCSMVRDAYFICKRYPDVTIITNLKLENFPEDTKILPLTCIQDILNAPDDTVVLIDEIENAGIDRKKALDVLVSQDKIVLMTTHDPLLALMADRRIVIQNGGIHKVLTTTSEEKELLKRLEELDAMMGNARQQLRQGLSLNLDLVQNLV